jgi:hypothetical protein
MARRQFRASAIAINHIGLNHQGNNLLVVALPAACAHLPWSGA